MKTYHLIGLGVYDDYYKDQVYRDELDEDYDGELYVLPIVDYGFDHNWLLKTMLLTVQSVINS